MDFVSLMGNDKYPLPSNIGRVMSVSDLKNCDVMLFIITHDIKYTVSRFNFVTTFHTNQFRILHPCSLAYNHNVLRMCLGPPYM